MYSCDRLRYLSHRNAIFFKKHFSVCIKAIYQTIRYVLANYQESSDTQDKFSGIYILLGGDRTV